MDGWTLLIGSHAAAATTAMVLGGVQLLRRRFGDRLHRWNGRAWVVLMVLVSTTSFWIREVTPGSFSWIHVLSVITLTSLAVGVVAIRRHDARTHAITMTMNYLGMIGAFVGVVAVPVRLVPRSFQQDWAGMTALTLGLTAAVLTGLALLSVAARRVGARRPAAA